MSTYYEKVKQFLIELEIPITREMPDEEMLIVDDEENAIKNLVIDCEDPIVIIEQMIMKVPGFNTDEFFKRLLQINRTLVHGAFVLDEEGKAVLFRDTLQLENLDKNELEGTIRALSLGLAEHASELIEYSKK